MPISRRLMLGLIFASFALPSLTRAQSGPDSVMFAVRIGQDTSRYMWMIRDGDRLTTVSANRISRLHVLRGEALLNADGSVERLEQLSFEPADYAAGAAIGGTRLQAAGDSTIVTYGVTPEARTQVYSGRGHFINTSHYYEAFVTLAAQPPAVGDSLVGQHFAGTLFPQQRLVVRRIAPDRVSVWSRPLGTVNVRLDADGQVVEFDGAGTSALNFTGTRVPWRDIDATIAEMLEQERAGQRFGVLSPRDSVSTSIGGAEIRVDYFRPYMRGRQIFGYIVPWDVVWRTGANLATRFSTTRALAFGDATLAPGSYTMWSLPTREGWTLIFNSRTGQWGTEYDPSADVLRVPMEVAALTPELEQFTIGVDEDGAGGVVRLLWESTIASARFTVTDR